MIMFVFRHDYICVESTSSSSPVGGARHGCGRGRVFDQQTETCQRREGGCQEVEIVQHSQTDKPIEKSDDKQGLFVEFIQFLIKIGMFNKNVVMSMLSNKEIFM